ncbi:MAG: class I SAM-dependent methyltransferase [Pseudohongiellaceae bacterium]
MTLLQSLKNLFKPAPVIDNDAGLETAGKHWGERARQQVELNRPNSWAECPVVNQEYICPLISGQANVGWLEYVARKYYATPVQRALSLGCGGGGLERHGLQLRMTEHFDAYDVSDDAIQLCKEEAEKSGQLSSVDYAVANLNKLEFEPQSYDAAFASQSVHHIENLEHYMQQVHRSLKTGSYFIINEFVGPNQFQWTDVQLQHCQRLLEEIPESLRQMIREPGLKSSIERPTIEFMNGYDPTEAIRSADIIPELQKRFELVERRDFGGTLLHLVLDNIAGNLSDSEEGKVILRRLFAEEQRLIKSGEIGSDFTLLVARKS